MTQLGIDGADGILADFGVSSWQFDQAGRGLVIGRKGLWICEWTVTAVRPQRMWSIHTEKKN